MAFPPLPDGPPVAPAPTMAFPPDGPPATPTKAMPFPQPAPARPPRSVEYTAPPAPVPPRPAYPEPAAYPEPTRYPEPAPYGDPYAQQAPAPPSRVPRFFSTRVLSEVQASAVSRRASTNALAVLAAANAVFLLAVTVPEIVPWWPVVFRQLAPLIATPLATGGQELINDQGPGLVQTGMLLAAFVAYVSAHRQGQYRMVGLSAAIVTAVLAVLSALMGLVVFGRDGALGAALAGIVALLAGRTANAMRTPVGPRADRIGTTFVFTYGLSLVIPLGVGRALFSPGLAEAAQGLAAAGDMGVRFLAMGHLATLWLYLGGLSVGIVFWVLLQLVPPWAGRPLVRPIAIALLVLAVGWVTVGYQASSSGKERTEQLYTEHPNIVNKRPGDTDPTLGGP